MSTDIAGNEGAALDVINWDAVKWETIVQESGNQIVFDTPRYNDDGSENAEFDVFIGKYTGTRIAQKDGEDFSILTFMGTDGKPYQTNAGWKLESGFTDIEVGTIVRIIFMKEIDVGRPDTLKDFRIDAARR